MAVLADEKWVENAARLLGKRLRYTPAEALWLGFVRLLNQKIGLTLFRSAQIADEALEQRPHKRWIVLGRGEDGSTGVSIDIARFYSTYLAAMSTALDLGGPRRRGRRSVPRGKKGAIERARRYGVDTDLLREGLRLSPRERLERLDENAAFLNAIRHT
jgi:hypothetical protein